MRRLFETGASSLAMATIRGLFPMLIGAGLFMAAEGWIPSGGWKFYLLSAFAVLLFLNGLRVVLLAWSRRGQKLATFEHGFALWRNRSLAIFRWEQVEEIEVSPEFFGFRVWCQTDQGRRQKLHFDSASDPTDQLRSLWRDLEEQCWRHRLPAILGAIARGEDAVFIRKTWGKETGTKVVVNRYGLAATPRFKPRRFLDWLELERLELDGEHLVARRAADSEPWLREHIMAVPGCVAIVEAGQECRRQYLEIVEQLTRDRCPAIAKDLTKGGQLLMGNIALSAAGVAAEDIQVRWREIRRACLDGESLELHERDDEVSLDVSGLDFRDRILLRIMPAQMQAGGAR
jgi:hypothetical protein